KKCSFGILTRQGLSQSVHQSRQQLKEFLLGYIENYNQIAWANPPSDKSRAYDYPNGHVMDCFEEIAALADKAVHALSTWKRSDLMFRALRISILGAVVCLGALRLSHGAAFRLSHGAVAYIVAAPRSSLETRTLCQLTNYAGAVLGRKAAV